MGIHAKEKFDPLAIPTIQLTGQGEIAIPAQGNLFTSSLSLGRNAQAGKILVELDTNPERRQIQEERARREALGQRIESMRALYTRSRCRPRQVG